MSFEMSTFAAATKQALTRDDILDEISSDVSRVQLHLQVNSFHSLALLLKYKWDIAVLKESFHASQDLSEFLTDSNVSLKTDSVAPIPSECQLCLAEEDVKGLSCRHVACRLCWKAYLKTKIESGNPSIECFDCPLLICNDRLRPLLRKSELLTPYQELIVNSYVESTSYLSWCSKNCGNVLRRMGSNIVSCSCGAKFCFQCKLYPHTPASCVQMRQWERECEDHKELGRFADKQSWEWIQNNTQDCPKCWAPIQKNGGCNHMSCEKCKHKFCWNCRRNCQFDYHGYNCKYPKATIVRPNLEKIALYLMPFNYQKQKLENTSDSSLIFECRRVLMYSYVYAYYQEPGKAHLQIQFHFQVLTRDDILNEISFDVTRVQLHLQLNSFHSLALLLKYKWDIVALKESFHASQDLSEFLIDNNVPLKTYSVAPILSECQLCLVVGDVKGIACRHMACDSCWRTYLKVKIESGNLSIECFDCSLLICKDKLRVLLGSTELYITYQKLVVKSYVESISYLTWCSENCGNAVRRTGSNNVSCSCGAKFCFQCKRDPHTPASCDQMRLWERACEEHKELRKFADKKSWKWIQNNTQACPQCLAPIQKNGGCRYMYCKKCKHSFCWNCRGYWKHEWEGHRCKNPKTQIVCPSQQKIASFLIPFNYHKRKTDDSSSISECRNILMYSYVYAYYQGPGKITKDFKLLQKMLRNELELEKSRQNLEKCEQLRKSILDYCISSQTGKKALTLNDVQNEISSTITKVQLLLKVNSFYVLTLLLKFKWDIDALKESFHASKSFNDFFIANNLSLKTFPAAPTDPECQLCCATEDVEGLACRHMACGPCWKTYLKNKIELGNPSIECFDCSLLICKDKLEALLGSTELFTAYQKLKNCGKAVRRTDSNNVTCSCGAKFCFQCNRDPHTPASCDHMRLWERACEHHKELGKFAYKKSWEWIQENTQECPKCWAPIQKNGGCQFMYCKHCKHKFCWICRGSWIYEWDHLCSFQKAKTARPNLQEIDSYLLQFNHHKQKLESNHESSSISECRRVLMYSYVYAYNQEPGKITEDFQQQQNKLNAELDLEKSKQSVKKCEQLRKSILGYCSSSRTKKETLTLEEIQKEITSTITKVQLLLKINSFCSLTLLLKFKWDIDALKESFHASNNLNDFFIANNLSLKTFPAAPTDPECQLCCATEDVEGLACRHMACGPCWKTYLKDKVELGNPSIECFDCSLLICKDKLEALLGSTELFTAYQKLVVNSYVHYVSHLTWCKKNCGKAVRRTDSNNVICSCGARFCFRCNRDPHTPASCDHMRLWERACEDHKELRKFAFKKSWEWIQESTQECPKCWAPIQKSGGCQFMYCKQCKHKFCWICRGTWIYEWDHLCSL
ncbi:unnamed protein product [Caenorhabditis brenneri]